MAKYRCLSDEILYNDNFLSLTPGARDLYNYINNKTDDFGFCAEVESIMRTIRAKPKDLQALLDKRYLIKLEDWLYLEKHFYINNRNLRKDRIKPTNYGEYLSRVVLKSNGAWSLVDNLQPNDNQMTPTCNQLQPNDTLIQYNTIQSKSIQSKSIQYNDFSYCETIDELKEALRGVHIKE